MDLFIYNDKKLELYLSNELPYEEIAALEDQLLGNEELFERLQVVAMNLIDRYLENEMTRAEKRHFEATFLSCAANRQKLEEACVLREGLERLRKKELPVRSDAKLSIVDKGFFSFRLPQFAAVILIFVAILIAWLVIRLQTPESNRLTTGTFPPPTPGSTNIRSDGTPSREKPSPSPDASRQKTKTDPLQQHWLFLRDEGAGVMGSTDALHLSISTETETLRLRFELLDDSRHQDVFRVSIKDQMGYPVFPSPGTIDVKPFLIRYRGVVRRAISVDVPVSSLKIGEPYRFEILDPYAQKNFVINKAARR